MTGDARIGDAREMPFLGERVGMTEAARLHFDSDLSRPGLRNLPLDHLKRSTRATHLDDAHLGHTHQTFIPPSTTMSAPVTYEQSDARKSATPSRANAMAAARPMLPPVPLTTHTFPERLPGI